MKSVSQFGLGILIAGSILSGCSHGTPAPAAPTKLPPGEGPVGGKGGGMRGMPGGKGIPAGATTQ